MVNAIGIILAGGLGTRFNGNIPKQYMKLNGKEIIFYSIAAFRKARNLKDFICVVNEEEYLGGNIANKYNVQCIQGGNSRNESLNNAILYISENYPKCTKVIIHEAARPFIQDELIDEYLLLLDHYDAVITAAKITDSIGLLDGQAVDRSKYHLIQAPEAFWLKDLSRHFSPASGITATVHQLPKDIKVFHNYDFKFNLKITYPEDLFVAEQLVRLKYYEKNKGNKVALQKMSSKKALVLGAFGGVGSAIVERFKQWGIELLCPTSQELDLEKVTVLDIVRYCQDFKPDIIINAAAFSATDDDGLGEMFDKVFKINLKANIILMEYAQTLKQRVNVVLFSSSSSTQGRKGIALYSAAKIGINSLVESLAEKMSGDGVYLNAIIPEKINTPMIQKLHKGKVQTRELLAVNEVMDAVMYYSVADVYGDLVHIRKGL